MSQLQIQKRIYIIPVGLDQIRAMEIPESTPDIVYIITQHGKNKDKARDEVIEVTDYFKSENIKVKTIGCNNYFDIFDIMSSYRWICDRHGHDQILINVGSGSKLTGIAGMIISGLYPNTVCYYPKRDIKTQRSGGGSDKIETGEIEEIKLLPRFPLQKFNRDYITVLKYLKQNGTITKKSLLEYLTSREIHLIEKTFYPKGKETRKQRSQQSLYNILKRNFVDPMVHELLIQENSDGELTITDHGKNMLKVFGEENFVKDEIQT